MAGCSWLPTEDLEHHRLFDRVREVDPFQVEPDEIFGR
jgi:predicted nucleic acid-binding protein